MRRSSYIIYGLCDPGMPVTADLRHVFYIGKSESGAARARSHASVPYLKRDDKWNRAKSARIRELQRVHGGQGYMIQILAELPSSDSRTPSASALGLLERRFIRACRSWILNRTDGGENVIGPRAGKPLSAAHKRALSKAHRGKLKSPAHRRLIAKSQTGVLNHNFGKTTPSSVKEKISAKLRGRTFSAHTRQLLSRPKTVETRAKMSLARKRWWNEKKGLL